MSDPLEIRTSTTLPADDFDRIELELAYEELAAQRDDMSGRRYQKMRAERYRLAWLSARRRAVRTIQQERLERYPDLP